MLYLVQVAAKGAGCPGDPIQGPGRQVFWLAIL
jgi:hypothetical protein